MSICRVEDRVASEKRRLLFERTKGQIEMTTNSKAAFTGPLAGIVGAIALTAMPALAGGMAEPGPAPAVVAAAPAPMPGMDWSGPYGGLQLEYGDVGVSGADDGDGMLGGIFAGYRYDFGDFVVGAEVDHNAADIDLPGTGTLDRISRLGVEAGFDAGRALFYGTAGGAIANVDTTTDDLNDNGYFYGIGMDYAVTDQIIVGAELLQHEFDDFDGSGSDVDATTFGINAAFRF
jgi:opacity protein-like surface antigen